MFYIIIPTYIDWQILPSQKRVLMIVSDKDDGGSVWIQGFTYYD